MNDLTWGKKAQIMYFGEWCEIRSAQLYTDVVLAQVGLKEGDPDSSSIVCISGENREYLQRCSVGSQLALRVWTVAEWKNSDLFDIVVYMAMVVPVVPGAQGVSPHWVECHAVGVPRCM